MLYEVITARREAAGLGASDAGPSFYERSVARFEPLLASERCDVVDTGVDNWRDSLDEIVRDLRG